MCLDVTILNKEIDKRNALIEEIPEKETKIEELREKVVALNHEIEELVKDINGIDVEVINAEIKQLRDIVEYLTIANTPTTDGSY